jgi:hypothetical protein
MHTGSRQRAARRDGRPCRVADVMSRSVESSEAAGRGDVA